MYSPAITVATIINAITQSLSKNTTFTTFFDALTVNYLVKYRPNIQGTNEITISTLVSIFETTGVLIIPVLGMVGFY
jgi:hypothetical protein